MNYNEAIEYIHNIPKFNRILGNDLLRKLLNVMGNPQSKLKFVHIGGTNGKGSTCTMVASALKQAGYKVGLFTSPYLEVFNERIRINGNNISNNDITEIIEYVKNIAERNDAKVSEFAFNLAVAFEYFYREKCDIVVLEVGLGGKLDATNVIENALVTAFTAIGLDHCQFLGNTLLEISSDKFGIIKPNINVVLNPIQDSVVTQNAKNVCRHNNSELIIPELSNLSKISDENSFEYNGIKYKLSLLGEFQVYNAITAIEILNRLKTKSFSISNTNIIDGINSARINARFEMYENKIIIDGAHNPPAILALLKSLEKFKKSICFIIGVMQDKDYISIVNLISKFAKQNNSRIIATKVKVPRALPSDELALEFKKHDIICSSEPESQFALNMALDTQKSDEIICVCGSLYLAGEIKSNLNKTKNDG